MKQSSAGARSLLERASLLLLCSGACLYILVYLIVALQRLPYPYELEWMEGGAVVHVQRILDGQAIYVEPTLGFVAYLYAPLYFYLSAAVALVTGNGFLPLRLVSFVASLGCFAFVFLIVRRRTSSLLPPLLATCLFAATFRISGAWFDIARVDSLYLFFLLAGIYAFDSPRTIVRSIAAPLLLFLSALTKQPAVIVAVALSLVALLTRSGRERVAFPLVFAALFGVAFLVMNRITAGWYQYYVFDLVGQHSVEGMYLAGFWTQDILQKVGIAVAFCLVSLWLTIGRWGLPGGSRQAVADICLLGSLFGVSYLSRIHSGGYDNVLMAVYAGIAIYFGLGFESSLSQVRDKPGARLAVIYLVVVQFLLLVYLPWQQIPKQADREQGDKVLERVSMIDGAVYWSDHPWYSQMIGKPTVAQDMAVMDVVRASRSTQWRQGLERDMAVAVAEGQYAAFVLDFDEFSLRPPEFDARYVLADDDLSGDSFRLVTGWDRRPRFLYVRRP